MGTIKLLVLAGAFLGGLVYSLRDKDGDVTPRRDVAIEKKVTELTFQFESLKEEIEAMKSSQEDADKEIRRGVQTLIRKVEALDNQDVDELRHEEIMKVLRFLDKRRK